MSRLGFLRFSRRTALWLFSPAAALVIWGELRPATGDELPGWDKLLHFTAYFGLSAIACVALAGSRRGKLAVLGLILLGALLELLQGATGRDMSLYDELANTLGAVAGALAAGFYLRFLRGRKPGA